MTMRSIRLFFIFWIMISIAVSFAGCNKTLRNLSKPLPLSSSNTPHRFFVVGFRKNQPVLLTLEISEAVNRLSKHFESKEQARSMAEKDYGPILWNEDNHSRGPYSFYINKSEVKATEKILTESLGEHTKSIQLNSLTGDKAGEKQIIFLQFNNDDYTYYYRYQVTNGKIVLLEYGDLTKSDGFTALCGAMKLFLPLMIIGVGIAAVSGRRS